MAAAPAPAAKSAAAVPQAPTFTPVDYSAAYAKAQGIIGTPAAGEINSLQTVGNNLKADYGQEATDTIAMAPTIQNIYTNLAAQLKDQETTDVNSQTLAKTQDIGTQKAAAAASGFDTRGGYEAAMLRSVGVQHDAQIAETEKKYGLQAGQLAAEESKDIQQLYVEADQAKEKGDTAQASIIGQIASLKMQQAQMVQSAASTIAQIDDKNQQDELKTFYEGQILDLKSQTLDLQQQRLDYTESKGSGSGSGTGGDIRSALAGGMTLNDAVSTYLGTKDGKKTLTANDIYALYNTTGTYGPAKESGNQLKQMGITLTPSASSKVQTVPKSQLSPTQNSTINKVKDGIKNGQFTRDDAAQQFPELSAYF